jgi:hypothetical protein
MNGFERYNIKYLSPTMISQWDQAPATLVLKRVFGLRGKATANMWRGEAVEAGLQFWFYNRDKPDNVVNAKNLAVETFWDRAAGEVNEETEKAAELVPDMVEQAIIAAGEFKSPIMAAQLRVDHYFDGLDTPFTGNMDFVLEDKSIIELKSTTRCPSSIETCSLSHKWQAATYATARIAPAHLLYVTAKKSAVYTVEPNDKCLITMIQTAKAMDRCLSTHENGVSLLKSLPLNVDSFYWDEEVKDAYDLAVNGNLKALTGPGTESLSKQGYVTFGKHAGKHVSDLPSSYCDWLLNPRLSNGEKFDVPEELQDAIKEMRLVA